MIDGVAGEGDDDHDWGLAPAALVDNNEAHGKDGYKREFEERVRRVAAGDFRGGVGV